MDANEGVAGADGQIGVQVPGRLTNNPGYPALSQTVARHAKPEVPDQLSGLFESAHLHVDRFETWLGATRLDSIDSFPTAELLPLEGKVDRATRGRIVEDCHTTLAPVVDPAGAITAPIEVHLITAHRK